jgi:periplasmic glucans biosynthesis protein
MKTHLVFAIMTIALLAFVIGRGKSRSVTFETVVELARITSLEKYKPVSRPPAALTSLDYDRFRDIRFKEESTLWRQSGLPFQARFNFTAGEYTSDPITVYEVNRNSAKQMRFSPDLFTFGPLAKLSEADQARGNFAGFHIRYPIDKPDRLDEVVSFRSASYFRPRAKNQIYGISARGIAVDTLGRENFPAFTTFWLVHPAPNDSEMKIFALLEGRDLTGAYEFRVQPGAETKIHVRARLFPRNTVKDVGFAPLTSMYWYGENTSNTFGGWRPEVHDSDGLQIQRANGEWIWRPLAWAPQRQVNTYADTNPRGFGLFQRDTDFTHYQDLEANYHLRPSAWMQPDGDWGPGEIVLMQNPARDEYLDNVVAYWRPRGGIRAGETIDLAYTLVSFTENGALPPIGRCVSTRIDYQEKPNFRLIMLDFSGVPPDANAVPEVWVGKNGILSDVKLFQIPGTNLWRVSFGVTTTNTNESIEMRCTLTRDGKPATETWSYTWVK